MRHYNGNDSRGLDKVLDPYVRQIAEEFEAFLDSDEPDCTAMLGALDERIYEDMTRQRKTDRRASLRQRAQSIAAAILLIFCVSIAVCMVGVAVGAIELPWLSEWYVRTFGDHSRMNSVDLGFLREQGIEFAPTLLPHGYDLDGGSPRELLLDYERVTFSNEQGQMGYFDHIYERHSISIDAEHGGSPVLIGEVSGTLYSHQDTQFLYWMVDGESFVLAVPLDVDALLIAESVRCIVP